MNNSLAGEHVIESDVVVTGYGGAGAAAAITAHDSGAAVIILEKMPVGGGNTHLSGGHFASPTGIEAIQHLQVLCFGRTDVEIIHAFVENSMKNSDWIRELGGESKFIPPGKICYPFVDNPQWPNVPGVQSIKWPLNVVLEEGDEYYGERLWRLLSTNVDRRRIRVMTSTRAKDLITNEKGEVIGVVAERQGEMLQFMAKRAVILTCGGFENNEAMKDAFLPLKPLVPFGSLGNTGDGIMMAQKVGAALWHMSAFVGYFGFKPPEYQNAFQTKFHGPGFIYVNKDGWRFTNETGWETHELLRALLVYEPRRPCYPHLPLYGIFDEITRRKGPLYMSLGGGTRDYRWSLDNSREIAKGWISQGKTISELARRISVDETTLENTVAEYGKYCKAGVDADFNRSKETLQPLEVAPYYAIELWPSLLNTQGGPRRDKEARVLDNDGKPIPRLYSAGEMGSLFGFLYVGGGNLGECLAFGRISGRNAAAEKPWC